MNKIFLLLIITIFNLFPNEINSLFEKGNEAYVSGNFEEAISLYNKIIDEGFESSELYYNIGNAYFKSGKLGFAVLNYERGLKLSPNDEDLIHNIQFVNSKLLDKIESVPLLFIFEWWNSFVKLFPINSWIVLSLIIYITLLTIIILFLYGRSIRLQKLSFAGGLFLFFLLIVFSFSTYSSIKKFNSTNEGIILSQQVNVKFSPDEKSTDSFILHEGAKIFIQDEFENWIKVKIADGKVGWIKQNQIGII